MLSYKKYLSFCFYTVSSKHPGIHSMYMIPIYKLKFRKVVDAMAERNNYSEVLSVIS